MNRFVSKRPHTGKMPTMLENNFSRTGRLHSFETIIDELEHIFNDRVDLETVLVLSHCVGHWLWFKALAHCRLSNFSLSSIFNVQLMCFDFLLLWSG